jgi:hypothetical protein
MTIDAAALVRADGLIETTRLGDAFRISKTDLAEIAGLSREAVTKTARLHSPTTQARLRDMVDILVRVLPWAGSPPQALAWYRAQPLPSFGDMTAQELVQQGRADDVKTYLARIAAGGYA